ncbi:hypothetical protein [Oceanobacillus massiliensis]
MGNLRAERAVADYRKVSVNVEAHSLLLADCVLMAIKGLSL